MSEAGPHRMLVVDDEPDMARGLRRILKIKGYDVHIAHTGEEAIERAREWHPNGILMDLKMPGINGVDAFREIRSFCPNAFVIFMTAFSRMVEEARSEGAIDVMTKPLDPEATCELIAKALVTRPVLIVDDDADFCGSLSRILRARGYDVQTATSASEAVAQFEKQPRSIVLLDMKLEGATGLDVLRRMKKCNDKALVIEMSGFAEMEGLMEQGMELAATARFHKPLDVNAVLETMEQAMHLPQ